MKPHLDGIIYSGVEVKAPNGSTLAYHSSGNIAVDVYMVRIIMQESGTDRDLDSIDVDSRIFDIAEDDGLIPYYFGDDGELITTDRGLGVPASIFFCRPDFQTPREIAGYVEGFLEAKNLCESALLNPN